MPNRIIKESLCSSEKISSLSDFDFRLWISLILLADDNGCGDARPAIIKGRAFPLRDRVTAKDLEGSLSRLAAGSCVTLYTVGGRPYYQFPGWSHHQRIRQVKGKYPLPDAADSDDLPQSAANCGELPQTATSCGLNPIRIQSESESESESEAENAREATVVVCDAEKPDFGTLEAYASSNLTVLSPRNMEDLLAFREEMDEDVIRHAIDEACAAGRRNWSYVRAILRRFLESGLKTMGDVKAAESQRAANGNNAAAKGYQQHSYTANDYASVFYNPAKDYGTKKAARNYSERPVTDDTYGKNSYSDPAKGLR